MADSNFVPKKLYGGDDRISELPNEILVIILSLLPLREAATTSVLSSRWRWPSHLWKHTHNLNFTTNIPSIDTIIQMSRPGISWDAERCKHVQTLTSIVQSHKSPYLKDFKLSLHVCQSDTYAVTKWLQFAFSRQVQTLELDFLCYRDYCKVELDATIIFRPPAGAVLSESLKSLCLKSLTVSGNSMGLLLRSCPFLERLVMDFVFLTTDVRFCGASLVLKHLDILNGSGTNAIKVSAPNLTWLSVDIKSEKKLLLENLPELVGADFTCRSRIADDVKLFASVIFCCASQLKFLSLCLHHPKVFLANDFPTMHNLRKLVVKYLGMYEHSLLPVTMLIQASPCLEEFKLVFVRVSPDRTTGMKVVNNVERSPHQHLRVFNFEGFCVDARSHIELVTYIKGNCLALEKIIVGGRLFSGSTDLSNSEERAQAQAVRDRTKQLLQGKVPHHVKLDVNL